ncbi:beta-ketoacyl-ACP synthase III [Tuwongella immobilis]|nr:beta-ketoacyl-ACP synthase III [Tuwongella immobilis]
MTGPIRVVVSGTGSEVPTRVMANAAFESMIDTSDEWIRTRTGIRERRFIEPGDTSATLGVRASRKAIESAGISPDEIDLIICATITPAMMSPTNACIIQAELGCRPVPAFDLAAACTGFVYALSVADAMMRSGTVRHALVVGAEVLSKALDFTDRNTCILFGDGAGAVVLSRVDDANAEASNRGLSCFQLHSDGRRGDLIQMPSSVTDQTPNAEGQLHPGQQYLWMHGREVFKFAVQRLTDILRQAMAECEARGVTLDWVVPHQVNQRIIDSALDHTGFPGERVMVNLDRYGNTSAASVPIALDELLRTGRASTGQTLLLVAFGGGLTWGSALLGL